MLGEGIASEAELDALEAEERAAGARGAAPRLGRPTAAPIDAERAGGPRRSLDAPRASAGAAARLGAGGRSRPHAGAACGATCHGVRRAEALLVAPRRRLPPERRRSPTGSASRTERTGDALRLAPLQRVGRARRSRVAEVRGRATPTTRRSSTASRSSTPASTPRSRATRELRRLRRGRRPAGRRQPGLRRPAGEVRRAARHRHRHPRGHDHRPGDRHGAARPAADRRDPVPRLHALRACRSSPTTSPPLRWRTHGGQMAPVIVRTRGHRLEGIWHSGSPMAGILNLVRGMLRLRAARHDPGRRLLQHAARGRRSGAGGRGAQRLPRCKERCRTTSASSRVPLGVPEVLRAGRGRHGRHLRRLLPHRPGGGGAPRRGRDRGRDHRRADAAAVRHARASSRGSLEEDQPRRSSSTRTCPGGATAYMLQQVLERQGGY